MPTPSLKTDSGFRACFEQYYPMVYRTALLLLETADDAEDAAQEIFLRVYRYRNTYDPERAALSTWIYRITVNHCNSRRRQAAWRYWIFKRWVEPAPIPNAPSPEAGLDELTIRLALQQLSDKLRAVVVLHFYNQLTYEQVAEILEIPVGTAKSRLHLALRALRTHFPADFEDVVATPSQEIVP